MTSQPVEAFSHAVSPDELTAMQVNLALAIYSRADEERVAGNKDAVPANFLRVFINLVDVLEANDTGDADRCVAELKKVLNAVY
jgi:hypothetical protein